MLILKFKCLSVPNAKKNLKYQQTSALTLV
jgi:hypothetical protein